MPHIDRPVPKAAIPKQPAPDEQDDDKKGGKPMVDSLSVIDHEVPVERVIAQLFGKEARRNEFNGRYEFS